jgi:hypothetical protein
MERENIVNKVNLKLDEATPPGVELPFNDIIGPVLDECAKDVAEIAPLHLLSPMSMVHYTTKRKVDTNVATLTLSKAHPYKVGDRVTVSGITDAAYNGDFTLTIVTTTTISYALTHTNELEVSDTGGIVTYKTIITGNKAYIPKPADFLRLYEMKFPLWQNTVRGITKPGTDGAKIQDNPYLTSGIGRPSVMLHHTKPTGGTLQDYLVCAKVEILAVPVALYIQEPLPETLPDQLLDALTWLAASKIMQISGYSDKAQGLFQHYQLSLTQLSKA